MSIEMGVTSTINPSVRSVLENVPVELGDATDVLAVICDVSSIALIMLGYIGLAITVSNQKKASKINYARIFFYAHVVGFALGIFSVYRIDAVAKQFNFSKIIR